MKIYMAASLLLAFGISGTAHAQSCRMGSGPDFGDGIPYCSEAPSTDYEPPQAEQPRWSSRWGAIAIDPQAMEGGAGVASGMKSRASAEALAIKHCHDTGGGKTCRIEVSYDNQCAVIAWGDDAYATANAGTIDEASRLGLEECGKGTSNCRIFYSDCSYPVRLR